MFRTKQILVGPVVWLKRLIPFGRHNKWANIKTKLLQFFKTVIFSLDTMFLCCCVHNNAWSTNNVAFCFWKILSINIIFHNTLKINSGLCRLHFKNIHFWSILCSHAFHSQSAMKVTSTWQNIPITNQVYCKQTAALIGYAVTTFLHKLLEFLKAELRSIIDVNH